MNQRQASWFVAILCMWAGLSDAQTAPYAFQTVRSYEVLPTPTLVNADVWAFGIGVPAGGVGFQRVQWTKRALGAGVGVGVAGIAAQGLVYPLEALGRFDTWKTYIAGDGLIAPWHVGQFRARTVAGFRVGMQRWSSLGSRFFDAGAGMATTHDGTWFGQHRMVTAHLAVGGTWR